ncbi:hypothetical protein WJ973_08975 [Achromobacter xylosoxidans]
MTSAWCSCATAARATRFRWTCRTAPSTPPPAPAWARPSPNATPSCTAAACRTWRPKPSVGRWRRHGGERRARPRDHIASGPATAARQAGTRKLYDFERNDWIEVPTYERQALDAEQKLAGPALVVEDETTTFVPAGFEACRSRLGSLVLDDIKAAAARAAKDPA